MLLLFLTISIPRPTPLANSVQQSLIPQDNGTIYNCYFVSDSNKYQLKYEPTSGEVSLMISRIGPGDEGEYTCLAKNQYGEAICTVYIQPEGEPSLSLSQRMGKTLAPIRILRVKTGIHTMSHSISLQCRKAGPSLAPQAELSGLTSRKARSKTMRTQFGPSKTTTATLSNVLVQSQKSII